MLRIWEVSISDANLVSRGGVHAQPDEDDYSGTLGEAKERKLILAPAQTTLAAGIDASQEELTLNAPVFDDPNFRVKIIGTEKIFVISGFGTNGLIIIREWDGTTPAVHAADAPIYDCYTYERIIVQASDVLGTDETGWFRYAPDVAGSPGSYVSSLTPARFTNPKTDSYTFWREITAPIGAAQRNGTTRHRADFEAFEYAA